MLYVLPSINQANLAYLHKQLAKLMPVQEFLVAFTRYGIRLATESMIPAQSERWRRGLGMQVERARRELAPVRRVAKG